MKAMFVCFWLFAVGSIGILASDFRNLDFNTPDLSHVHTDPITRLDKGPVTDLLAGWNVLTGDERDHFTGEITISEGASMVALTPAQGDLDKLQFGAYRVTTSMFSNPGIPNPSLRPTIMLNQTGDIPSGVSRLVFYSSGGSFADVKVSINGQEQSVTGGPSWKSVNVEPFAGKAATLEFLFPKPEKGDGTYRFDIRGFAAVPEPGAVALTVLGIGVIGLVSKRDRRPDKRQITLRSK